jgi:hypothetical protein
MLLSLGVLRTAVFAEPAIAEIKEVVSLIQESRVQKSDYRSQKL